MEATRASPRDSSGNVAGRALTELVGELSRWRASPRWTLGRRGEKERRFRGEARGHALANRAHERAVSGGIVKRRRQMEAARGTGGNTGGIGLGGILVIVGIVLMIVWSFWVGLIVTLVGLIAFGGFAKGKWY